MTDTDGEAGSGVRRNVPITAISKSAGRKEAATGLKRITANRNWFIKDTRPSAGASADRR